VRALCHRPVASSLSEQKDFKESLSYASSSQLLGSAVKQLAPDLQSPLVLGKNSSGSNGSTSSGQLNRNPGIHHNKVWENWLAQKLVGRITSIAVLGCIMFATFKLAGMSVNKMKRASKWNSSTQNMETSSLVERTDLSVDIAGRLKKLLAMVKIQFRNRSDAKNPQVLSPAASLSSSMTAVYRRLMPMEEAEALVRQWQAIKAEALGPNHQVHSLSDVLDESMLVQVKCMDCFSYLVMLSYNYHHLTIKLLSVFRNNIV
jgi:hypothetical protein